MADQLNVQERVQGTGTWNLNVPINFFSYATYKDSKGAIIRMPIGVAGEHITGKRQGPAQTRS